MNVLQSIWQLQKDVVWVIPINFNRKSMEHERLRHLLCATDFSGLDLPGTRLDELSSYLSQAPKLNLLNAELPLSQQTVRQ